MKRRAPWPLKDKGEGKDFNMFHFGADYYPEHWPEARWSTDAKFWVLAEKFLVSIKPVFV